MVPSQKNKLLNLDSVLTISMNQCHLDNSREVNLHLTCEAIVSMIYRSFLTFSYEMIQLEYFWVQH